MVLGPFENLTNLGPDSLEEESWACSQYPPAKWIRGADGKMECVNLIELKQQKATSKLNQDIFALTFSTQQIPPYAQTMSKKKRD